MADSNVLEMKMNQIVVINISLIFYHWNSIIHTIYLGDHCRDGEFTCKTGECVPDSRRCDRRVDCRDGSDEKDCPGNYMSL